MSIRVSWARFTQNKDRLKELATESEDSQERLDAVRYLSDEDQTIMEELACSQAPAEVRAAAIRRVKDDGLLVRLALEDGVDSVRGAAAGAIKDLAMLTMLVRSDVPTTEGPRTPSIAVRRAAAQRISILLTLADGLASISPDPAFRWERLKDIVSIIAVLNHFAAEDLADRDVAQLFGKANVLWLDQTLAELIESGDTKAVASRLDELSPPITSRFARALHCPLCQCASFSDCWPLRGDTLPFSHSDASTEHSVLAQCGECEHRWHVAWDKDPGPAHPLWPEPFQKLFTPPEADE